ncbi:DsrE family protein [Olivibacter sp. SDN3]|uniref:DsrE family protein n=1 Tax=Olivibacter sp. SDN3 TaxID=2764720 RepID=UPI001651A6F9|nr:DsrE family protein [Olivibacter sp. SDN3]QNL52205.1 DsrE family protein [Olivibacter sp. SDN3]
MKKLLIALFLLGLGWQFAIGQEVSPELQKNLQFKGAEATKTEYNAIFQLDTNNPEIVKKTFRNIRNVLTDKRLIGKLTIELVTFSGGTDVMLKSSPYIDDLKDMISKGVQVAQCENSLRERNLTKEDILGFIPYVPSGNGELIIRASQGWVVIKP